MKGIQFCVLSIVIPKNFKGKTWRTLTPLIRMQGPYYEVVEVLKMLRREIYVFKDVDVSF